MLAFCRQFAERTDSSSSSTERNRFSLTLLPAPPRPCGSCDGLGRLLEVDEDGELLLEDLRGEGDGVLGADRAVGPDLERQLVVVGLLADARVGDREVHLADRREQRVDRDRRRPACSRACCARPGRSRGRFRRAAPCAAWRPCEQVADAVVGVQDLDAVDELDVAGGDRARAVLLEADRVRLGGVAPGPAPP